MDKLESVLRRFPQNAYDTSNKSTALYKLIESIIHEFNTTMSNIDRIDKMIGIDTVLPDDIDSRFGTLLGIKRNHNEEDEQYRARLKTSITSLSGGTAEAIKYAIACGLGTNNDPIAMDRIHVYDAWEYDGSANVNKNYGYVVCEVDLNKGQYSTNMADIVTKSANSVKATGIVIQFVYHNYRVVYYSELDDITYVTLDTSTYSQVGE